MKYAISALFFLVSLTHNALAQAFYGLETTSNSEYFRFGEWTKESKTAVIFADVCNVRASADAKAEVIGKLSIGTNVQIMEVSTLKFTQAGITAPWIKIKSSSISGYVWGGLLTNAAVKTADGKMLVWGLIEIRQTEDFDNRIWASVRLIENGVVESKHDFPVKNASRGDEGFLNVYAPPLLQDVKNLIIFGTPSEACGVMASQHYFLYAGGKLVFVGSGYSVGDAGVFSSSLEYVFPYPPKDDVYADYHYTPDPEHIKRVENEGSFDDNCDWIETSKSRDFKWADFKMSKHCDN